MRAAWRIGAVVLVLATTAGCGAPDDNAVLQPELGLWQKRLADLPAGARRGDTESFLRRNGAKDVAYAVDTRTLRAAQDTEPPQLGAFPFLVVKSVAITCHFDANERLLRCEAHASRARCCKTPT